MKKKISPYKIAELADLERDRLNRWYDEIEDVFSDERLDKPTDKEEDEP